MAEVVLLADRQPEVNLLEAVLWEHGLHTTQRDLGPLRAGTDDLAFLLTRHPQAAVVYVGDPRSPDPWTYLCTVQEQTSARGRPLVVLRCPAAGPAAARDALPLTEREADLQRAAQTIRTQQAALLRSGSVRPGRTPPGGGRCAQP